MLLLTTVLLAAPASSTHVVLFDHRVVACHRAGNGWFTGRACEQAALGAKVQDHHGTARTLPKQARDAMCGAVEGHRAIGKDTGTGTLWSTSKAVPCPALPSKISPANKKAINAALRADFVASPAAWRTWDARRDAKPLQADTWQAHDVMRAGTLFVSVHGLGRGISAVLRLGKAGATVVARSSYGPAVVVPDRCTDGDGDGVPEVWVAIGGETERSYALMRFIDGHASTIAQIHCGD